MEIEMSDKQWGAFIVVGNILALTCLIKFGLPLRNLAIFGVVCGFLLLFFGDN